MGWLGDAAEGIGGAIKDAGEAVGDAVDEVADVAEGISGAGDWLADQACALGNKYVCGSGSFLGGIFSGSLSALGGSIRGAGQFTEGVFSAAGNSVQGRWKDAINDFASATIGVLLSGWEGVTVIPRIADETVRNWQRNQLRNFASELIDNKYEGNPARHSNARKLAGVDTRIGWGMDVRANYRCLEFSTFDVDLKALHDAHTLDLYQLAGYHSGSWITSPEAEVFALRGPDAVPAEGDFASRGEIDSYLRTNTPGLLVRSINNRNSERARAYAERIARDVGMHLKWETYSTRVTVDELNNPEHFPLLWRRDARAGDRANHSQFLNNRDYRNSKDPDLECHIEAFGVLWPYERLADGIARGVTIGLDIDEDHPLPCPTPGRDDNCCSTIFEDSNAGTSVAFAWPRNLAGRASNRFILAHEIGHWMGLCHRGHDEITQIMFTIPRTDGYWDKVKRFAGALGGWATFARGLQHPRFTGPDGRNIWRFTVDQRLDRCLQLEQEPVPVE